MKKFRILCLILCIAVVCSILPPLVSAAEEDSASVSDCNTLDAVTPYLGTTQLVQNLQAAFLYEQNSDTLMYAWNPDMPVFPSSLVKLIAAFVAIEYGNMEEVVTVSEEALSQVPYDAVSAKLQVGEEITLEDLIYCMLVGSANDAASVIATHVSGTEEAFVEKMNGLVKDLGCTATVLKNSHGLHDAEQISTARDLARILSAAMGNELFRKFFSTSSYTVPATNLSEERHLSSTNLLVNHKAYYDERVTGGRTGIAEDGTRCLASTAETDGLKLICIVMGSKSVAEEEGEEPIYGGFRETTALYDLVTGKYELVKVLYEGQAIGQSSVINGDCDVVLGSQTEVTAILPAGVKQEELIFQYSNKLELSEAPIEAGEKLTSIEIWHGNMCIAKAELSAMNAVRSTMYSQESTENKKAVSGRMKTGFTVIGIIVVLSVAAVLAFLLFTRIRRAIKDSQTKRYRRGRRRSR